MDCGSPGHPGEPVERGGVQEARLADGHGTHVPLPERAGRPGHLFCIGHPFQPLCTTCSVSICVLAPFLVTHLSRLVPITSAWPVLLVLPSSAGRLLLSPTMMKGGIAKLQLPAKTKIDVISVSKYKMFQFHANPKLLKV